MEKTQKFYFLLIILFGIIAYLNKNVEKMKPVRSSKKIVIITGSSQGLGKQFSTFFNPENYLVITHGFKTTSNNPLHLTGNFAKESDIKKFVQNIKEKYGPIDIFINSFYDSSNWDLDYQQSVNVNNSIKLINQIIPLMKSGGKIINISSGVGYIEQSDQTLNNYLFVKSSIDKYFKIKSMEYYKKSIGFVTLKIDSPYSTNLNKGRLLENNNTTNFQELKSSIDFITKNKWNVLTGREFYSSRINGKKLGYYLELEYPRLDDNSLNKQIITNVYNGESVIEPDIKDKELCVYSNNQNLLTAKLSQIHQIEPCYINLQHGIFVFLEKMISVFVPLKHQIISSQMGYLNIIGRDRTIINISPFIKNNWAEPNYEQILSNINSMTRMIYFVGPLNKKSFDKFISQVPFNIVIIVDFCYDGFIVSNDNIKMQDYLNVPNTIITINTFSKFYGLPGIHLSWSIAKKDIGSIITNYFHYPINLYYEKVALEVLNNETYLNSVIEYYNQERNKLGKILSDNKIKYYFEFPNTIVIEKPVGLKQSKFDDDYEIKNFLTQTSLIYYFRVNNEGPIIKIRLFISKSKNNNELIAKILQIFK